jgi:hypothetical protein
MRFAVDIDGVVFERDAYPELGKPNWEIIYTIADLQVQGHLVHMFTSREGKALEIAKKKCDEVGLMFDPYDFPGKKVRADFYVDDRAIQPTAFPRIVESFIHGKSIEDRWAKDGYLYTGSGYDDKNKEEE